jgi:hypothetical protein
LMIDPTINSEIIHQRSDRRGAVAVVITSPAARRSTW